MSKAASSVSVIGGADGPTSIFLAGGKEKNIFRRLKNSIRRKKYCRSRKKAVKQIVPGEHSMEETIRFMKSKYNAYEADETYPSYEERMRQLRCSIIQKEKPGLVGVDVELQPPDNLEDEETLFAWMKKMDERYENIAKNVERVTQEVFPTNCHLYIISTENGTIEIELEDNRGLMGTSICGTLKKMQKILKDIYLYYGVSEEDIKNETQRYLSLVAEMSC